MSESNSWFDEVTVEMKLGPDAYRLMLRCISERDKSAFSEKENVLLDNWIIQKLAKPTPQAR